MGKQKLSVQRRTLACTGGYQTNTVPYNDSHYVNTQSWLDTVTFSDNVPLWKSMIRDGKNVSTIMVGQRAFVLDYSFGDYRTTSNPANANYASRGVGQLLAPYLRDPYMIPTSATSAIEQARTLAEIQFSKRFNRHTTQFETGVFAGELLQTVRMLVNPAKDLRNSLATFHHDLGVLLKNIKRNEFRSGRTNTLKAIKDAIAGSWLTWQFGVKPLMSDLDDAARAFRALASGRTFENVRFTGQGKGESSTLQSLVFNPGPVGFDGSTGPRVDVITKVTAEVDLRGAWKSDVTGSAMPVPMIFGAQFGDILPTAWELIPWSWFADYFTNIGDVLGAWAMRGVNFNWLNETVRTRVDYIVNPPPRNLTKVNFGQTFTSTINCGGPLRILRYNVTRRPYTNQWDPKLLVKIPGVTGSDQNRWLNIAAVLAMRKSPIN